jgi:PAS domain S-box-containing protein
MATLMRDFDWSATSLGAPSGWPAPLKTLVNLMLNSTQPMFIAWGPARTWLYNDAFTPILGRKHPTALGAPAREVGAEAWADIAPLFARVFAGEPVSMEDFAIGLDRRGTIEEAHFEFSYSPVLGEDGQVTGLFGACIETTQTVMAHRQLALAHERQLQVFAQLPRFIGAMAGPNHIFEYVNDAYEKISGRTGFPGRTVREMFPELEGQGFFESLDQVYRTGEPVVMRGMELRLQGSHELQYIDFVYQPLRDVEGAVSGILVGGHEVTEAYRAQASLRELNATLERRVIERAQARGRTWQVSPDLLGALNAKTYFETSNPAWKTLLGWTEAEVASMSIFELLHPDDVERTRVGFQLTQEGQPAIRFPNRYRRKDGSYRWISWVGVPEDGFVYCSGRDITAEVEAEEALAKTQEALRQSQKMEAVGQLTGGIAHDFNNMLAIIMGGIDLALRRLQRGDTGVQGYLQNAREGATRAAALTQRLLAFSRQSPLEPRVTDINTLMTGMSDLLRRTLGERVELQTVLAAGLWATNVDGNQLENAIINLAVNARDAMPDGGKLTIEVANTHLEERYVAREIGVAAGQYVMISVTDIDTGIAPEVLDRVFDPFFTTKSVGKGTGLGLSMVYGFAKQSGGHVRVYSELGRKRPNLAALSLRGEESVMTG